MSANQMLSTTTTSSSSTSQHQPPRTFEQVWSDLSNNSYQHLPITLQDFLAVGPSGSSISTPDPATILSLNYNSNSNSSTTHESMTTSSHLLPFPQNPSLGFFPFASRKRPVEEEGPPVEVDPDRRRKRMMKNRESAARSRARKQAYTNELEMAVCTLTQENAKLRAMNDEMRMAMAAQLPVKKSLVRTSTAPF